jgi:tetratricopeptide (TPR) repeat protein
MGGTPGFQEKVRHVLRTADPDSLIDDLAGDVPGALSEAREVYFERIIATRLYEALNAAARDVVSRLAVSELPLPVDAVMQLAGVDESAARSSLKAGVAFGLLQQFDEPNLPSLYHPPGLLRPWLSDPARLSEQEAAVVHRRLAAFWRSSYESDREAQLRVPIDVELWACRGHAERGHGTATLQWAAVRLARILERRAEWGAACALLEQIPEQDRDADCLIALASVEDSLGLWKAARAHLDRANQMLPDGTRQKAMAWHQLATIDVNEGDYAAAREKCAKSLQIKQAIGDRAGEAATWLQLASIDVDEGDYAAAREKCAKSLQTRQAIGDRADEAATWHNLASIDLNEGDYAAACEKFAKSLQIIQAIGDRAGEAATFIHLGVLAHQRGNRHLAARLVGICWLIDQDIGHADTERDFRNLAAICSQLGYDQAQFDAAIAEVGRAYLEDRGRSLVDQAIVDSQ